jgi:hypothetical protein
MSLLRSLLIVTAALAFVRARLRRRRRMSFPNPGFEQGGCGTTPIIWGVATGLPTQARESDRANAIGPHDIAMLGVGGPLRSATIPPSSLGSAGSPQVEPSGRVPAQPADLSRTRTDGALYLLNHGGSAGGGEVLRFEP